MDEKTIARFWAKVDITPGCWEWRAAKNKQDGYGVLSRGDGKLIYAHRLSWLLHSGPLPDGMCICHKCDNPTCVNPDHLFLGTPGANTRDMIEKGRSRLRTHGFFGETSGNVKLNAEQVLEIRRKAATEKRCMARLAREFDVSPSQIHRIVTREAWPHLP